MSSSWTAVTIFIAVAALVALLSFYKSASDRDIVAQYTMHNNYAHQRQYMLPSLGGTGTETFREGNDDFIEPRDMSATTFKNVDYDSSSSSAAASTRPSAIPDGASMSCTPRDKLTAEDLLPKNAVNTAWAQTNPVGTGALQNVNLLSAGYNMGVNTVGSSHKNPNMSLRSDPVIPKQDVSPWLVSTIEPDQWRKKLDE